MRGYVWSKTGSAKKFNDLGVQLDSSREVMAKN